MKFALWGFLLLVLIGLGVNFLLEDNGYVLIEFLSYSIETSLPIFLLALVVLYILVRLLGLIWHSPKIFRQKMAAKKIEKSNKLLHEGLNLAGKGNFAKAEKKLKTSIDGIHASLLPFLIASDVSQKNEDEQSRDEWLKKALAKYPESETYIMLHASQQRMEEKNYTAAQDCINTILDKDPNNPIALNLLSLCLYKTKQWELLTQKAKSIMERVEPDQNTELYIATAFVESARALKGNQLQIEILWNKVPYSLENNVLILATKIESMMLNSQVNAAEKELKKHIPKTWNKKLITLFAKLENPDLSKLSRQMDRWLVDRPRDANLWQAASHLAKRDELWTQAKRFIERSIEINESPIAYNQLGFILLELGQQDAAKKAFEQSFNLNND